MSDEKKLEQAKQIYKSFCNFLDSRDWHYQADDEKLIIRFGVSGEDLPVQFVVVFDSGRQLIRLLSPMEFRMSESKRIDGAIAACVASNGVANGSFDYDISDGTIVFRMVQAFGDSKIGEGLFEYMILSTNAVVDEYNHQFLAIDKGMMSISDFIGKCS